MKSVIWVIVLLFIVSTVAMAAEPAKVSVAASDQMLSAVAADVAKQAGASIIVDPEADTKLTMSLTDMELPKALDGLAKMSKLTWKKVDFAKPTDPNSKVTLSQIKSSIIALAKLPLAAASIQDSSGKSAAFVREGQGASDVTKTKLPEGYAWATVYVFYDPAKLTDTAKSTGKTADAGSDRMKKLAEMTPEQRRQELANETAEMMMLTPEARRQLLADQFSTFQNMDPTMRQQYFQDMRQAMRNSGMNMGFGGGRGNRGNRGNRPGGGTVIVPAR